MISWTLLQSRKWCYSYFISLFVELHLSHLQKFTFYLKLLCLSSRLFDCGMSVYCISKKIKVRVHHYGPAGPLSVNKHIQICRGSSFWRCSAYKSTRGFCVGAKLLSDIPKRQSWSNEPTYIYIYKQASATLLLGWNTYLYFNVPNQSCSFN